MNKKGCILVILVQFENDSTPQTECEFEDFGVRKCPNVFKKGIARADTSCIKCLKWARKQNEDQSIFVMLKFWNF